MFRKKKNLPTSHKVKKLYLLNRENDSITSIEEYLPRKI